MNTVRDWTRRYETEGSYMESIFTQWAWEEEDGMQVLKPLDIYHILVLQCKDLSYYPIRVQVFFN